MNMDEKEIEFRVNNEDSDGKYRVWASLSFAILLLGVGVPLWWHTTTVPRVPLPYSEIEGLSNLHIRIHCKIVVAALSRDRAESLAKIIEKAYRFDEIYHLEVTHQMVSHNMLAQTFNHHEMEKVADGFHLDSGDLLLLESPNLYDSVLVGQKRTVYFSTETSAQQLIQVLSKWMLVERSLALTKNALTEPTFWSLDVENRRRFPASPAYDVLLTLVNPDPEKLKVNWDLQSVAEAYLEPFFDELNILANFTVKSQWLYLLPLELNLRRVPDTSKLGRHFALSEDILSQLVTPLETRLASQISLYPCMNLVVYAVPCENAPIYIYTRSGSIHKSGLHNNVETFLSPRWGGVILNNPSPNECQEANGTYPVVTTPQETTIVGIFLAQLRLLLGVPEITNIDGVSAVPMVGHKLRDWELDTILRIRTIEQLTSAKLTLQSLAQLLNEINNIVITEVVGQRIKDALRYVQNSAQELKNGRLKHGFVLSKKAFVVAEAAFSDPSLLALPHFPEDQKYAVYIPLFLPAMIPVLLSLKNIYSYYFPKKKIESIDDDQPLDPNQ